MIHIPQPPNTTRQPKRRWRPVRLRASVRLRALLAVVVLFGASCTPGDETANETTSSQTASTEATTTTAETTTSTEPTTTTLIEREDLLQWSQPGTPEAKVETAFWLLHDETRRAIEFPRSPERPELAQYAGGELLSNIRTNVATLETEGTLIVDNSLRLLYEVVIDGDTATVEFCGASSAEQILIETGEVVRVFDGIRSHLYTAKLSDNGWVFSESESIGESVTPNPESGEFGCLNDFAPEMVTPDFTTEPTETTTSE